jgi:hypothetical protein
VSGRSDKVQAGVNTEINLINTARLLLLQHIRLMLVIQELDDGHPRIAVVDIVAEARSIDDRETD